MINGQIQLIDAAREIADRVSLVHLELMLPAPSLYMTQHHLELIRRRVVEMQETIGRLDPSARIHR